MTISRCASFFPHDQESRLHPVSQISSLLRAAKANSLFISAATKNVHLTLNFGTPPTADAADLVVQNLRMLRHRAFPHERRHACTRFCLCKFHRLVCACVLRLVDATDATKVAIFSSRHPSRADAAKSKRVCRSTRLFRYKHVLTSSFPSVVVLLLLI